MEREKPKCCGMVYTGYSYMHPYSQCSRSGVVEHEGKLYCRQHSPEEKAKRDRKAKEKYDRSWSLRCLELAGPSYAREVGNLLHAWDNNLDVVISQSIDNLRRIHEGATGVKIKPPTLQLEGPGE